MRAAALALALLIVQAPVAAAADEHAARLSPEENILWAHPDPVEHRNHHRMDTKENAPSAGAPGTDQAGTSWRWTITLKPTLNETLVLDANATIRVEAYIGGSGLASVNVATMLHHGGETIAEGEAQEHVFTPEGLPVVDDDPDEEYTLLQWDLDVENDRLEPGQELVWSLVATGQFSGIHMGMDPTNGQSHLVLPIIKVVPHVESEGEEELVTPAPIAPLLLLPLALLVRRLRRTGQQDEDRP